MRRLFLLVGVCLTIPLVLTPAANAQEATVQRSAADVAEGAPLPPAYVLERDGTVTIEGDLVTDCRYFTRGYKQPTQERLRDEARAVADQCRQLGIPSGDVTTGNSEIVLSLGTIGPITSDGTNSGVEALPDTGGLPLVLLPGLLAVIFAGGLLLKRFLNVR